MSAPGRGGRPWRRARAAVLAEEYLCRRCGLPVDKTLPGTDRWGPVVDHCHEITHGGHPLDRANLGLMHRTCNQDKENDRRRRPRTNPSRDW